MRCELAGTPRREEPSEEQKRREEKGTVLPE
jgi:hypothetical protein